MIETQNPIKWLQLKNNRQLAINPKTGGWLLLDDVSKDIVQKIESGIETEAIFNQCDGISLEDIDKLKYLLHTHNLLTSKTDSRQSKCSSTCALKEYPTLAVLKITLACNLKCVYCYSNAGIDQSSHMSTETAHKVVDEYVRLNPGKSITVVLHGGEPLINFKLIKDLVEYSKKYDNKVIISIQTNASMVTDEIAEFIKSNNIQVGVSLDGPAPFQNTARVLQNGKGSLDQTLRGIRILQKHGVLFGVLGVMTSNVAEHIDEVLDFYLANNIYSFSFIPLMKVGRGGNDSSLYVTGEQIFKAYKRIYERVVENNTHNQEKIHERTLADMASSLFANENTFMCSQIPCGAGKNMLGFSNNGDIYICDDFIGDPDMQQAKIYFIIEGKPYSVNDEVTYEAFNEYFGGGFSGLVMNEIREKRSMAYTAVGYFRRPPVQQRNTCFFGYVGTQSDKVNDAIDVYCSLLDSMPRNPENIGNIRTILRQSMLSNHPTFRTKSQRMTDWYRLGYQIDPATLQIRQVQKLKFEDIERFYEENVQGKPVKILVIGDPKQIDLKALRAKFGKINKLNADKLFGE